MPRTWIGAVPHKARRASGHKGTPGAARSVTKNTALPASRASGTDSMRAATTQVKCGPPYSSNTAVPPEDSCSMRDELTRAPLRDRGVNSRPPGPRATLVASPANKTLRSSTASSSKSPRHGPGSGIRRKKGSRANATTASVLQGQFLSNGNGNKARTNSKRPNSSAPRTACTPNRTHPVSSDKELVAFARSPKISRTPPESSCRSICRDTDYVSSTQEGLTAFAKSPKISGTPPGTSCPLATSNDSSKKEESKTFMRSPRIPRTPPKATCSGSSSNANCGSSEPEGLMAFGRSPRIPRTPPKAMRPPPPANVDGTLSGQDVLAVSTNTPKIHHAPPSIKPPGKNGAVQNGSCAGEPPASEGTSDFPRTPPKSQRPDTFAENNAASREQELTAFARTPKIPRTPPKAPCSSVAVKSNVVCQSEEELAAFARTPKIPRTPPKEQRMSAAVNVNESVVTHLDTRQAIATYPTPEDDAMVTVQSAEDGSQSSAMTYGRAPGKEARNSNSDGTSCKANTSAVIVKAGDPSAAAAQEDGTKCTMRDLFVSENLKRFEQDAGAISTARFSSSADDELERTTVASMTTEKETIVQPADEAPLVALSGRSIGLASTLSETAQQHDADSVVPYTASGFLGRTTTGVTRVSDSDCIVRSAAAREDEFGVTEEKTTGVDDTAGGAPSPTALHQHVADKAIHNLPRDTACAQRHHPEVEENPSRVPPLVPIGMVVRCRGGTEEKLSRCCVGISAYRASREAGGKTGDGDARRTTANDSCGGMGGRCDVDMSGYERTLTPAAFENLASCMRTPSTLMGGAKDLVEKVQPIGSLDTANCPAVSKNVTPGASFQLHLSQHISRGVRDGGIVPMRTRASSLSISSSSATAAAAAAAAASAKHRISKSTAGNAITSVIPDIGKPCRSSSEGEIVKEDNHRAGLPGSPLAGVHSAESSRMDNGSNDMDVERDDFNAQIGPKRCGDLGMRLSLEEGSTGERSSEKANVAELRATPEVCHEGKDAAWEPNKENDMSLTLESMSEGSAERGCAAWVVGNSCLPDINDPMSTKDRVTFMSAATREEQGKAKPSEQSSFEVSRSAFANSKASKRISPSLMTAVAAKLEEAAIVIAAVAPTVDGGVSTDGMGGEHAEITDTNDLVPSLNPVMPCIDEDVPGPTLEDVDRQQASPEVKALDPFARRSELPRTPVEQPPAASPNGALQENAGEVTKENECRDSVDGRGGEKAEVTGAIDLQAANMQIGELHREVASMADRLAKQTEERNRLTDVAFEAQDEVANLRRQLEVMQRQQRVEYDLPICGSTKCEASSTDAMEQAVHEDVGLVMLVPEKAADSEPGPTFATRVLELEVEKWEVEQDREAAKMEAEEAKRELDRAQARMRELAAREEQRKTEWLEEELRRAQGQCAEDEKQMEERRIKAQLLVAETRAEMLRARVLEEENERAKRSVRTAAAAMARRATTLVEELCSRNRRMARRAAGLREGVEECEERVALLTERSGQLEHSGRAAKHDAATVREELEEARKALAIGKAGADALSTRLGSLEQEYLEALKAREELSALVKTEEARRTSVERRLSDVRHSSEATAGFERARRESTERRLGVAERKRDELAAAAVAATGPALRAAADAERARRLSVERRLDAAERAREELTAAAVNAANANAASAASAAEAKLRAEMEAERRKRMSLERRLEVAEREKTELARVAASAAEAAVDVARTTLAASTGLGPVPAVSMLTREEVSAPSGDKASRTMDMASSLGNAPVESVATSTGRDFANNVPVEAGSDDDCSGPPNDHPGSREYKNASVVDKSRSMCHGAGSPDETGSGDARTGCEGIETGSVGDGTDSPVVKGSGLVSVAEEYRSGNADMVTDSPTVAVEHAYSSNAWGGVARRASKRMRAERDPAADGSGSEEGEGQPPAKVMGGPRGHGEKDCNDDGSAQPTSPKENAALASNVASTTSPEVAAALTLRDRSCETFSRQSVEAISKVVETSESTCLPTVLFGEDAMGLESNEQEAVIGQAEDADTAGGNSEITASSSMPAPTEAPVPMRRVRTSTRLQRSSYAGGDAGGGVTEVVEVKARKVTVETKRMSRPRRGSRSEVNYSETISSNSEPEGNVAQEASEPISCRQRRQSHRDQGRGNGDEIDAAKATVKDDGALDKGVETGLSRASKNKDGDDCSQASAGAANKRGARRRASARRPPVVPKEEHHASVSSSTVIVDSSSGCLEGDGIGEAPHAAPRNSVGPDEGVLPRQGVSMESVERAETDARPDSDARCAEGTDNKESEDGQHQHLPQQETDGTVARRGRVKGSAKPKRKSRLAISVDEVDAESEDTVVQAKETARTKESTSSTALEKQAKEPKRRARRARGEDAAVDSKENVPNVDTCLVESKTAADGSGDGVGGYEGKGERNHRRGVETAEVDKEAGLSTRASSSKSSRRRRTTVTKMTAVQATEAAATEAPTSPTTSPLPPPPKRSRRLRGIGAARCKTPKVKTKAGTAGSARPPPAREAAASGASTEDDVADATSDDPVGNLTMDLRATAAGTTAAAEADAGSACDAASMVGAASKRGSTGSSDASTSRALLASSSSSVGAPSNRVHVTAGGERAPTANIAGAMSGAEVAGGSTRPPLPSKAQATATSVLGLRRSKSKIGATRTSFFQGFLDPKNGFKAPRLKPGAKRP